MVEFSHYAKIDCPNAWPGLRNPVRYGTLDEFGITDPEALEWRRIRRRVDLPPLEGALDEDVSSGPLTIPQAKAGLALGLGVPETAIEILVKF
jgi:hypothetical protein